MGKYTLSGSSPDKLKKSGLTAARVEPATFGYSSMFYQLSFEVKSVGRND